MILLLVLFFFFFNDSHSPKSLLKRHEFACSQIEKKGGGAFRISTETGRSLDGKKNRKKSKKKKKTHILP